MYLFKPQYRISIRIAHVLLFLASAIAFFAARPLHGEPNVAGRWKADSGELELRQKGSRLDAAFHPNSGLPTRHLVLSPSFTADRLTFAWFDNPFSWGTAELTLSADSQYLIGNRENLVDGSSRRWRLTRETQPELLKATVRLPMHRNRQEITYEVRNGLAIFQGDIILGSAEEIVAPRPPAHARPFPTLAQLAAKNIKLPNGIGAKQQALVSVSEPAYLWWGGVIPYEIRPGNFEREKELLIESAAKTLSATNLSIEKRTRSERDYIEFVLDKELNGGRSAVGRQGGRQVIYLGGDFTSRTVMHELLHAAGTWHEQSRPDRDSHVTVVEDNIDDKDKKGHNFAVHLENSLILTPYDVQSIMHYDGRAFGKVGDDGKRLPTILDNSTGQPVSASSVLSSLDKQGINRLYPSTYGNKDHLFIAEEDGGETQVWTWNKAIDLFVPSGRFHAEKFDKKDMLLAADVSGDRKEELLVVEDDGGHVLVLGYDIDQTPSPAGSFNLKVGVSTRSIGAGDVCGDDKDEIVVADGGTIRVWGWNTKENVFEEKVHFQTTFDGGDTLAVGDVLGLGKAQILIAEDDGGIIEVYVNMDHTADGSEPSFEKAKNTIETSYDKNDSLLAANVADDPGSSRAKDEILVMEDDNGRIEVWGHRFGDYQKLAPIHSTFDKCDSLAVGDVLGDDKQEVIVLEDDRGIVEVWQHGNPKPALTAGTGYDRGDAIAVGLRGYRP